MTLSAWLLLAALVVSFVAGFLQYTENRFLRRKNKQMSATRDRLAAVIPQLEADVTALEAKLTAAEANAGGTSDAQLDPLVSRLEALHVSMNPATVPAPPPAE